MQSTILLGNSLEVLKTLPEKSVDCCVTSPPYYGLRDYGADGQIGLEETPEKFIERLVLVFKEVKRVLKDNGTLWVNIGDSYCSTAGGTKADPHHIKGISADVANKSVVMRPKVPEGLKPKDLIGIPWMLAFALRADGWYLRSEIIWHKPNPMPESVKDRPTKAHEQIFLLSKLPQYYYDAEAIKTDAKNPVDDARRIAAQTWDNKNTPDKLRNGIRPTRNPRPGVDNNGGNQGTGGIPLTNKANKRSVWTVNTKPFKEAHFATYPVELITPCVLAGCPIGGTVLDPFCGAASTGVAAVENKRNFIGIELNPQYKEIGEKRLATVGGHVVKTIKPKSVFINLHPQQQSLFTP